MLTQDQIDEWPVIKHHPKLNTEKVCALYSEKDGVPVKYVCTTALGGGVRTVDVFYRPTPHPEFGNRYFGLYRTTDGQLMITNADVVESLEFGMIQADNGEWHYSQHRHDYVEVDGKVIDGGRAYMRGNGFEAWRVVDGGFARG